MTIPQFQSVFIFSRLLENSTHIPEESCIVCIAHLTRQARDTLPPFVTDQSPFLDVIFSICIDFKNDSDKTYLLHKQTASLPVTRT